MTDAQNVAAEYRERAKWAEGYDRAWMAAELNAIADVVEALDEAADGWPRPNKYDAALAAHDARRAKPEHGSDARRTLGEYEASAKHHARRKP